jgi:mono/diheme cytochrome c family protein
MLIIMRKTIKWLGTLFLIMIGMGLLTLVALYYTTENWLNQTYSIHSEPLRVPVDTDILEQGKYIASTRGQCFSCHGEDFSGTVYDEGFLVGRLSVPNLTGGAGGIGASYSDEDWVRAIRHGVNKEGRSLIGMPSEYFYTLSDDDLVAIIAYIRSLPAVDAVHLETRLGPYGRLLILQGEIILPARLIDHDAPRPAAPVAGVTREYGKYLAHNCTMCHGANFAGGGSYASGVNLTPGGDLKDWSEEDFITALRTGFKPNGELMDKENMPFESLGKMSDDELKAIWMFLQSLPVVENVPTPEI